MRQVVCEEVLMVTPDGKLTKEYRPTSVQVAPGTWRRPIEEVVRMYGEDFVVQAIRGTRNGHRE